MPNITNQTSANLTTGCVTAQIQGSVSNQTSGNLTTRSTTINQNNAVRKEGAVANQTVVNLTSSNQTAATASLTKHSTIINQDNIAPIEGYYVANQTVANLTSANQTATNLNPVRLPDAAEAVREKLPPLVIRDFGDSECPPQKSANPYWNFIKIECLLKQIGKGIGFANKELIAQSKNNDVGFLAVKTADVSINFEMSTIDESNGLFLGAKTFSLGFNKTETTDINRGVINLHIVAVAPEKEISSENMADIWAELVKAGVIRKTLSLSEIIIRAFISILEEHIPSWHLSLYVKNAINEDMNVIKTMIGNKQLDQANMALSLFAMRYASHIDVNIF
jgi:hypothetical protein